MDKILLLVQQKNQGSKIFCYFFPTVLKVNSFATLEEHLNRVGLNKELPGVTTFEEGVATYLQWSTREEIEHYGFLGIWVKVD